MTLSKVMNNPAQIQSPGSILSLLSSFEHHFLALFAKYNLKCCCAEKQMIS